MSIYRWNAAENEGTAEELPRLWEALGFDEEAVRIVSLTGAGGKTTVMYRLAEELKEMGKRVIVTTSTHILYPDDYQVELLHDASEMGHVVWKDRILVVGGRVKEVRQLEGNNPGSTGDGKVWRKLGSLELSQIAGLADWCDVVLMEADGSRRLALKVPAGHEPVIIPETDAVIGCAGLTCIGKLWEDGCFRPELAGEVLRDAGYEVEAGIRPADVAHILIDKNGTRKQAGDRPYRIVLNQADGEPGLSYARLVAAEISRVSEVPVVITWNLR